MKLLIPPPVQLLVAALLMWAIANLLPVTGFEFALQFRLAFFFVAVAIAIDIAAIGLFRRMKTTVNPITPDKTAVLVTEGIYRFSRNPMYLGMVLILIGFGIWLGNFLSFAIIPVFVLYITRFQIEPEEKLLGNRFGADYEAYCAKVRRWI